MLKYILLAEIRLHPMTGYDLKRIMDGSTMYFWHAHHSQIYTTLRRLEEKGLIESDPIDEDDPLNKRVYHITQIGRVELDAWLNKPLLDLPTVKEDFLVRLYFSGFRSHDATLSEMMLHRTMHVERLKTLREEAVNRIEQSLAEFEGVREHGPYWKAVLRFGIAFEEMYIAWLDETIAQLQTG